MEVKETTTEKECEAGWCEYWTAGNNCKRCENDCKHLSHIKTCQLEPTLERCYKVKNCYYKLLQAEKEKAIKYLQMYYKAKAGLL